MEALNIWVLLIGAAVCLGAGFLLLLLVLAVLLLRRKKQVEPASGLAENLADYPPAPPRAGGPRLRVRGRPCRLRLAVLAPAGRRDLSEIGEVDDVLNKVVRGLGDVARADKARRRVWPPQLSSNGFAPAFLRETRRPAERADGSRWLLIAGPARAGAVPILLGLAVRCETPGDEDHLLVEPHQWAEVLRVED